MTARPGPSPGTSPPRRATILLLSADAVFLSAATARLTRAGLAVLPFTVLADVEARARPDEVDLVLLSAELPELRGGDDLAQVARRLRTVRAPIWLMGAAPDDPAGTALTARAAAAGFDGSLSVAEGLDPLVARLRAIFADA